MLSPSQIGVIASGKSSVFVDGDADVWMDIQGLRSTAWPNSLWYHNSTGGPLASNLAPNSGSLGGYWGTASVGNIGSIGSNGNVVYFANNGEYGAQRLYGLTTDTAPTRIGPEKHYAARWDGSQTMSRMFPGIYMDTSIFFNLRNTITDDATSGAVLLPPAGAKTVYYGWDASGGYIECGGNQATFPLPTGDPNDLATSAINSFPSSIFVNGEVAFEAYAVTAYILGFARTTKPGSRAEFKAWFDAQFP